MKKFARDIVFIYLVVLLASWGVFFKLADSWWVSTAFQFAPRWILAVPLVFAFPITLGLRPLWAPSYVIHALIIVFPIMGFQIPTGLQDREPQQPTIRVITYNVGGGEVFAEAIVRLVNERDCDVLLLQECQPALSARVFDQLQWNVRREGLMAIGSRYPLGEASILARHYPNEHNAVAVACEIDVEGQAYTVVNVHLPTPRPGLAALWNEGVDGIDVLKEVLQYRDDVSSKVSRKIGEIENTAVVCGDFNMPQESFLYRRDWTTYQNAFASVGQGFGYTKCTRWHGVRIDHVLTSQQWRAVSASVEESLGGDHRPVLAELLPTP